jgi:hypothetical protein
MKEIIMIAIIAAVLLFSISVAPILLVQAQNETQTQPQGNQTGNNNNSSIPIAPGALIYPSYKPCKERSMLCPTKSITGSTFQYDPQPNAWRPIIT